MKGETTMNMNEVIVNVKLGKVCSIKADKDSTESKSINLMVKFDGATLASVFDKAVSGAVIAWQNGVGRKNFDTFKPNQTVEIQFTAPAARAQMDPMDALLANAKAANMTPEAYLMAELKKRQA
jgi:hypothetical protein